MGIDSETAYEGKGWGYVSASKLLRVARAPLGQQPSHKPQPTSGAAVKEFKRPGDLDRHVQSIHFSVRSNCRVMGCSNNRGNGFSRSDKLRDHEKKAHVMH
jgi:hypothetical protein